MTTPDETWSAHVVPGEDLIEHSANEECICGPTARPVQRDDGSYGWVYMHHALDGRSATQNGADT
jgi:hypothetical protein